MNVDELMRKIKEDVTRRRGPRVKREQGGNSDVVSSSELTSHWIPAGSRLGLQESYTVGDFVALNDADFVETCYRVLLRRPADVMGLKTALVDLRGGARSKLEILGDVRFSEEGMARCVHVDGLLLPFKLQKWTRNRFFGRFLSWVLSAVRLPVLFRRIDATQARDARETHILGAHVNELQTAMELAVARCSEVADTEISALRTTLSTQIGVFNVLQQQVNDYAAQVNRLQELLDASMVSQTASRSFTSNDVLYAALEDRFRGSREDIKERSTYYLETVRSVLSKNGTGVIVDLGCGRGEWLDVLAEQGLQGVGVDLNRLFVDECLERNHNAVFQDALEFLKTLEPESVAVITSMHLVEHLTFDVLVALIDQALRVLVPGGALVLETPNPENIVMSTQWFYLDPTHRNPIPHALLSWLVGSRGFEIVTVENLNQNRGLHEQITEIGLDIPGATQLNKLATMLNAAPDYAVLARKG